MDYENTKNVRANMFMFSVNEIAPLVTSKHNTATTCDNIDSSERIVTLFGILGFVVPVCNKIATILSHCIVIAWNIFYHMYSAPCPEKLNHSIFASNLAKC